MISRIKENDFDSLRNALAGKFGWSEKDPKRRFYLQNIVIGTVSPEAAMDESGNEFRWLVPWNGEAGDGSDG